MLAAIVAAEAGERVTLLEGSGKLGRKILISGNGRCNLTNKAADDLRHYHGKHPRFVRSALNQFRLEKTLAFFADLGSSSAKRSGSASFQCRIKRSRSSTCSRTACAA